MTEEYQTGEVESRTKEKVLSLKELKSNPRIFTNGKLYAAVSTKSQNFELSIHTQGVKAGLSTGLIHGSEGIKEHAGFIEFECPSGQCDIGAIYHISKHLDLLSLQVEQLNRSLEIARSKQEEILDHLHISLLASLRQAGCDFKFALRNLDIINEHQLHSTYAPAIVSGIQGAERVLHEKALHWDGRLKYAERDFKLWSNMPTEIEKSIYFKSLFLAAIGHAAQALLMNGNEHVLALSRLKLKELALPILSMLKECRNKKDWIYSNFVSDYKLDSNYLYVRFDLDRPEDAISKLMEHADRMIEAVEYLVNLSFVDFLNPHRACMVLEASEDLQDLSVGEPLIVPEAIKKLVMNRP